MYRTKSGLTVAAVMAASTLLGASASAQETIYNATSPATGITVTDQGSREIGDVVSFGGTSRFLTDFSFEYFAAPSGNESFQVFLRALDGPGGSPGSILYDSGVQGLSTIAPNGSDYYTFNATGLSLLVPDSLAWTVAFSGFENNEGGLLFADSVTTGSSPLFNPGSGEVDFFYRKSLTTGWEILTTAGVTDNFAARFTAVAVPEPSTWALIIGGLASFGYMARRRKS